MTEEPAAPKKSNRARRPGVRLFVLSCVPYAAAVRVGPLQAGPRLGIAAGLAVGREVAFWVAALLLGREVVSRYRRFLNPQHWLGQGR